MGISRGAIKLIGTALRAHTRTGTVITFGVQSVQATAVEALALLRAVGVEPTTVDLNAPHLAGRLPQEHLFKMLGFDRVEAIDFYSNEKPTHIVDLNSPVPEAMCGKYDLVYDGGTAEHCFAASQVFCNALRLARVGGLVIHHLPMNNWVDHGFYQFSPTLFYDFYGANGCEDLRLIVHFSEAGKERWIAYDPVGDSGLPYALGSAANVLLFFSARKVADKEQIVFPIQGRYRRSFGAERGEDPVRRRGSALARLKRSVLKRTLKWRARAL